MNHTNPSIPSHLVRFVAGTTATLFLFTNVLFAHSSQVSLWDERRASLETSAKQADPVQLASLPMSGSGLTSSPRAFLDPLRSTMSSLAPASSRLPQGMDWLAALPLQYGHLRDVYKAPRRSGSGVDNIVVIQDVHMNLEAQTNIASLLQGLIDRETADAVFVEAAFEKFNFEPFRSFPNKRATQAVADAYLKGNKIGAPSYVGVTSPANTPSFIGIDDKDHYEANVSAYRAGSKIQDRLLKGIKNEKGRLKTAKELAFNSSLKHVDQAVDAYEAGAVPLADLIRALLRVVRHEESRTPGINVALIRDYLEAYRIEKSLDFSKAEKERARVLESLVKKAAPADLKKLMTLGLAYRSGHVSYTDFYGFLTSLVERSGLSLERTPSFKQYVRYVSLCDGIKAEELFAAIHQLKETVFTQLAKTDEERSLLRQSKEAGLREKLVTLALTPEEWAEYKNATGDSQLATANNNPSSQSPVASSDFSPFEKFYREADIRSEKMVENLIKTGSQVREGRCSVLVTGGFHTPQITQLLKERGMSFAVVTPNISKVETETGSAYLSMFNQEKSPLDQLFEGRTLFLGNADLALGTSRGPNGSFAVLSRISDILLKTRLPAGQAASLEFSGERFTYAVDRCPSGFRVLHEATVAGRKIFVLEKKSMFASLRVPRLSFARIAGLVAALAVFFTDEASLRAVFSALSDSVAPLVHSPQFVPALLICLFIGGVAGLVIYVGDKVSSSASKKRSPHRLLRQARLFEWLEPRIALNGTGVDPTVFMSNPVDPSETVLVAPLHTAPVVQSNESRMTAPAAASNAMTQNQLAIDAAMASLNVEDMSGVVAADAPSVLDLLAGENPAVETQSVAFALAAPHTTAITHFYGSVAHVIHDGNVLDTLDVAIPPTVHGITLKNAHFYVPGPDNDTALYRVFFARSDGSGNWIIDGTDLMSLQDLNAKNFDIPFWATDTQSGGAGHIFVKRYAPNGDPVAFPNEFGVSFVLMSDDSSLPVTKVTTEDLRPTMSNGRIDYSVYYANIDPAILNIPANPQLVIHPNLPANLYFQVVIQMEDGSRFVTKDRISTNSAAFKEGIVLPYSPDGVHRPVAVALILTGADGKPVELHFPPNRAIVGVQELVPGAPVQTMEPSLPSIGGGGGGGGTSSSWSGIEGPTWSFIGGEEYHSREQPAMFSQSSLEWFLKTITPNMMFTSGILVYVSGVGYQYWGLPFGQPISDTTVEAWVFNSGPLPMNPADTMLPKETRTSLDDLISGEMKELVSGKEAYAFSVPDFSAQIGQFSTLEFSQYGGKTPLVIVFKKDGTRVDNKNGPIKIDRDAVDWIVAYIGQEGQSADVLMAIQGKNGNVTFSIRPFELEAGIASQTEEDAPADEQPAVEDDSAKTDQSQASSNDIVVKAGAAMLLAARLPADASKRGRMAAALSQGLKRLRGSKPLMLLIGIAVPLLSMGLSWLAGGSFKSAGFAMAALPFITFYLDQPGNDVPEWDPHKELKELYSGHEFNNAGRDRERAIKPGEIFTDYGSQQRQEISAWIDGLASFEIREKLGLNQSDEPVYLYGFHSFSYLIGMLRSQMEKNFNGKTVRDVPTESRKTYEAEDKSSIKMSDIQGVYRKSLKQVGGKTFVVHDLKSLCLVDKKYQGKLARYIEQYFSASPNPEVRKSASAVANWLTTGHKSSMDGEVSFPSLMREDHYCYLEFLVGMVHLGKGQLQVERDDKTSEADAKDQAETYIKKHRAMYGPVVETETMREVDYGVAHESIMNTLKLSTLPRSEGKLMELRYSGKTLKSLYESHNRLDFSRGGKPTVTVENDVVVMSGRFHALNGGTLPKDMRLVVRWRPDGEESVQAVVVDPSNITSLPEHGTYEYRVNIPMPPGRMRITTFVAPWEVPVDLRGDRIGRIWGTRDPTHDIIVDVPPSTRPSSPDRVLAAGVALPALVVTLLGMDMPLPVVLGVVAGMILIFGALFLAKTLIVKLFQSGIAVVKALVTSQKASLSPSMRKTAIEAGQLLKQFDAAVEANDEAGVAAILAGLDSVANRGVEQLGSKALTRDDMQNSSRRRSWINQIFLTLTARSEAASDQISIGALLSEANELKGSSLNVISPSAETSAGRPAALSDVIHALQLMRSANGARKAGQWKVILAGSNESFFESLSRAPEFSGVQFVPSSELTSKEDIKSALSEAGRTRPSRVNLIVHKASGLSAEFFDALQALNEGDPDLRGLISVYVLSLLDGTKAVLLDLNRLRAFSDIVNSQA